MIKIDRNEGVRDRTIRVFSGLLLITVGWVAGGTGGWLLGFIGMIPLLTGAVGWCPLYHLFGINTCPLE